MNTPKYVLLVDDNPDIRLHLGNLLLRLGYRVETFEHANELLRRTVWPPNAVVLLDMRMPAVTGLETQQALARVAGLIPVIFISGESQPQEIVEAMKAGAVDFLIKPFGVAELSAALTRGFERARTWGLQATRQDKAYRLMRQLSIRECEVLELLLRGHSNRNAAQILGVKPDTVKKHRASIYEKAMVHDLPELLALFDGLQHLIGSTTTCHSFQTTGDLDVVDGSH